MNKICNNCGQEVTGTITVCCVCGEDLGVPKSTLPSASSQAPETHYAQQKWGNPAEVHQQSPTHVNSSQLPEVVNVPTVRIASSGIHDCIKCGSANVTPFNSANTKSGFSFLEACCGFILLGPLGVLCGMNSKIKTSNQTHWMCQVCGNQFRDPTELLKEKRSNMMKGAIVMIVFGVIAVLLTVVAWIDGSIVWWLGLIGIGLVAGGIGLVSKARAIIA